MTNLKMDEFVTIFLNYLNSTDTHSSRFGWIFNHSQNMYDICPLELL